LLAAARKSSRYSLLYKEGSDSFRVTTWNRQRQKQKDGKEADTEQRHAWDGGDGKGKIQRKCMRSKESAQRDKLSSYAN